MGTGSKRSSKVSKCNFRSTPHDTSATTHGASITAFSFSTGSRMTASWLVILRPRARSTLAPNANLLKSSVFSGVGTKRCFRRGLFSRRSSPSRRLWKSASLGSPAGRPAKVVSDEATVGASLTVENRLEVRAYDRIRRDCEGDKCVDIARSPCRLTDWAMMGLSDSSDVCLAMSTMVVGCGGSYIACSSKRVQNSGTTKAARLPGRPYVTCKMELYPGQRSENLKRCRYQRNDCSRTQETRNADK